MKSKRTLRAKAMPLPVAPGEPMPVQPESIMDQIGALYRERLRAHYNNDAVALDAINRQIESLKEKL